MNCILIIDDDHQMRTMTKQILERAGYQTIEAENGDLGIALFKETPADLVITDLIMPEKDGMETVIELKREFPNVKIIAVSGGSRAMDPNDYLHYAEGAGVLRTFTKPFDPQELLQAIEELLQDIYA